MFAYNIIPLLQDGHRVVIIATTMLLTCLKRVMFVERKCVKFQEGVLTNKTAVAVWTGLPKVFIACLRQRKPAVLLPR